MLEKTEWDATSTALGSGLFSTDDSTGNYNNRHTYIAIRLTWPIWPYEHKTQFPQRIILVLYVLFSSNNAVNDIQLILVVAFEFTVAASRIIYSVADSVKKVGQHCSRSYTCFPSVNALRRGSPPCGGDTSWALPNLSVGTLSSCIRCPGFSSFALLGGVLLDPFVHTSTLQNHSLSVVVGPTTWNGLPLELCMPPRTLWAHSILT